MLISVYIKKVLSTLYVSNAALFVRRFFSQTWIFSGFSPYSINLDESSLQIFSESFTWEEKRSSEAAMGGGCAALLCAREKVCEKRVRAAYWREHGQNPLANYSDQDALKINYRCHS